MNLVKKFDSMLQNFNIIFLCCFDKNTNNEELEKLLDQGVENDASVRLPNLSFALYDLHL